MNKSELISAISAKTGSKKREVEPILNAVIDTIIETVANEEKVHLMGFGTFECYSRKERTGRDPRNGENIVIPAAKIPTFKCGKTFKDAVKDNTKNTKE